MCLPRQRGLGTAARHRAALAVAVLAVAVAAAPATAASPDDTGTTDLANPAVAQITGLADDAGSGRAVVALGDVNRDGTGDYAISSPKGAAGAGVVQVVFSRGDAPPLPLADLGTGGFQIQGTGPTPAVAPAGDLNGDGSADLLIGRRNAYFTKGGTAGDGIAYVVFGQTTSTSITLQKLSRTDGFRIAGTSMEGAGASVAALGDLDGDTVPEIAVGAPAASPLGRAGAGRIAVVLSSRRQGSVNLASAGNGIIELDGAAAGDRAGSALAALPDVDADGRPDLAIGAPGPKGAPGAVAIVHLPAPDAPPIDLAALVDQQRGAVRTGAAGEGAGSVLASAGDRDGDGVGDLLVGVPGASPYGRTGAGAVYLMSGTSAGAGPLGPGAWLAGGHRYDMVGAGVDAGGAVAPGALPATGAVLVGAPIRTRKDNPPWLAAPLGRSGAGSAWVIFPAVGIAPVDLALPPPGRVQRLAGPTIGAHSGSAVALLEGRSALIGGSATPPQFAASLVTNLHPPAATPPGDGCNTTNLEVVIDDSSSMLKTDPSLLRRQALDLLLTKPSNAGRVTGAVEFGSWAAEIFPPVPAPGSSADPVHDRLEALLDEHLRGDAIFTNYNAGLLAAGAQNPDADARIFITDGGHGRGGAIAPFDPTTADGTKTYVISLRAQSPLKPGSTDDQRLQDIAGRTGGAYFRNVTAEQLGPVLDTIDALALACGTALPTAATAAASSKAAPTTTDLARRRGPEPRAGDPRRARGRPAPERQRERQAPVCALHDRPAQHPRHDRRHAQLGGPERQLRRELGQDRLLRPPDDHHPGERHPAGFGRSHGQTGRSEDPGEPRRELRVAAHRRRQASARRCAGDRRHQGGRGRPDGGQGEQEEEKEEERAQERRARPVERGARRRRQRVRRHERGIAMPGVPRPGCPYLGPDRAGAAR